MADKGPHDKPLTFFDLPREMRDMVYDFALVQSYDCEIGRSLIARVRNSAATNLLTTSRQVCEEYKQRAKKYASLRVYDTGENDMTMVVKLPQMLTTVATCDIDILVSFNDITYHEVWVQRLLQCFCRETAIGVNIMWDSGQAVDLDEEDREVLQQFCAVVSAMVPARITLGSRRWFTEMIVDNTHVEELWIKHNKELGTSPTDKQWCPQKGDFVPLINTEAETTV